MCLTFKCLKKKGQCNVMHEVRLPDAVFSMRRPSAYGCVRYIYFIKNHVVIILLQSDFSFPLEDKCITLQI